LKGMFGAYRDGLCGLDFVHPTEVGELWRAVVNMAVKLQVP